MERNSDDAASVANDPQWEPSPPEAIQRWLDGKTPADFDAIEVEGRTYYPETIRRRNPQGEGLQEVKVLMHTPNNIELMRARVDALDLCARLTGRKTRPTRDEAIAVFGAQYFDDIDTICLLSYCLHDADPLNAGKDKPAAYPRYMLPEYLDRYHPRAALHDVYARLSFYQAIEDPRVHELDEDEFVQTIHAIAKARNLSPLVVIDGRAHDSYIVSMAVRLSSYLTP